MSLPVYALYGLTLATGFPFSHPLPRVEGGGESAADLVFRTAAAAPAAPGEPLWESPERQGGWPQSTLFAPAGGWQAVRFAGVGDFWLGDAEIVAVAAAGASQTLVELRLLGPVLALWLERSGVVALHAAAVVVGGRAVAFLASNHGGKSSLAAGLMQLGAPLLTDDLMAVEAVGGGFVARPGYPQMRFWPAEAVRFAGAGDHPRVHPDLDKRRVAVGEGGFGSFCGEPRPLAAILLPERGDEAAGTRFEAVPPALAVVELLRRSFLPRLAAASGLQPHRLGLFARLVETVPLQRVTYPRGYPRMARVSAELIHHIAQDKCFR